MKATLKGLVRTAAITGGLEASHLLSRLGALGAARGLGAIFTLHHVRPYFPRPFAANGHLEVSPDFLDAAIRRLKAEGYRFLALDDLLGLRDSVADGRPFAVFTLDDGYRDNAEHALPVFERHGVPFTVFVTKGFSERSHTMWWETAEALLNATDNFTIETDSGAKTYKVETLAAKRSSFDQLSQAICGPGEDLAIARLDAAARSVGIDPAAIVADLVMTGEELQALSRHPLAHLGAHTISHRALDFLADEDLLSELTGSADYVEALVGHRPKSLAYPYGDQRSATRRVATLAAKAGFTLAVTTRAATIDQDRLAEPLLLPRISLNGLYQKPRYVAALASGIPFRLTG
ncbi:MAG: polysaccharide deacetylase family protein [Arenimonas sp.]|nr:polysaccharide deacetylase family protein [Rhizobium sp.]MBW8445650.1 polysaccharide deacetylase family protein [Arenimonas sp.]